MSSFGERLAALTALAFLAALVAIAVVERSRVDGEALPAAEGAPAPGGGWYQALAAARGPTGDAERTTCGLILTGRSLGVIHPVLPCGAKLLFRFGGDTVLTEVIDNRLDSAGRQFEVTPGLARRIGLDGTQQVQWRFVVTPDG